MSPLVSSFLAALGAAACCAVLLIASMTGEIGLPFRWSAVLSIAVVAVLGARAGAASRHGIGPWPTVAGVLIAALSYSLLLAAFDWAGSTWPGSQGDERTLFSHLAWLLSRPSYRLSLIAPSIIGLLCVLLGYYGRAYLGRTALKGSKYPP